MIKIAAVIAVVLLLLAGGAAWYLHSPAGGGPGEVRLPLSDPQRRLLGVVPADAEAFALIPAAAALHRELLKNRVTRGAVDKWSESNQVPRAWMLGAADVVVWRTKDATGYAFRVDRVRALLVRIYLKIAGGGAVREAEGMFTINRDESPSMEGARIDEALALARTLPAGDVLAVQLEKARGAFPPIGRPAVTAVELSPSEIRLTSRAPDDEPDVPSANRSPDLATGALLSASFRRPPRLLGDLDRLLLSRVSSLLGDGGSISIYDVDTGTLLPRPRGVISVPASESRTASAAEVRAIVESFGALEERNGQILLALDRESLSKYEGETLTPSPWPGSEWAIRADPARLVPLLEKLGDNTALRIAAPRLYRSARDLRKWIRSLEEARSIDAALLRSEGVAELRVKVVSK